MCGENLSSNIRNKVLQYQISLKSQGLNSQKQLMSQPRHNIHFSRHHTASSVSSLKIRMDSDWDTEGVCVGVGSKTAEAPEKAGSP